MIKYFNNPNHYFVTNFVFCFISTEGGVSVNNPTYDELSHYTAGISVNPLFTEMGKNADANPGFMDEEPPHYSSLAKEKEAEVSI